MPAIPATSYDEVPYDSHPRYATHPDCLATLATLLGMQAAPPANCRVLELGCAAGGNLLPLAEAFPESRFVGVDLSVRQIDTGRTVAAALGLTNLDLRACSILDVDASFGAFDYVIAHGVYSWVPTGVREHILRVCQHNLAPNGVAYISYNTYPGWHLRAPVREMMAYHLRDMEVPAQRIAQSRALLAFLARAAPAEGVWGRLLREENELVAKHQDWYLFHEHLEEENQPFYFHQFMERARAHGLQYLGEAGNHAALSAFPEEVRAPLKNMSADLLQLEQYLDFIRNRMFRQTLLVHQEVEINRTPTPEVVYSLKVSALANPTTENPDVGSPEPLEFINDEGVSVTTGHPLAKAAMMILFECWPLALPFEELWRQVQARLGPHGVGGPEPAGRAMLARSLVHIYLSKLVALHVDLPPYVTTAGDRPRTTPLIRLQAATGAAVTNRRHRMVTPRVIDRAVLRFLDGSRDRPALVEALTEKVLQGELELQQHGQPLTDAAAIRAVLETELEGSLHRLGQSAVLLG